MTTMMMIARELSPPPSLDPAALPLCDGAEGDNVDTVGDVVDGTVGEAVGDEADTGAEGVGDKVDTVGDVVDGTVGAVGGDEVDTGGEVVGDDVGTAGEVVSSVVPQNEEHVTSLQP